ncbi:MAG: protein BatD, partial [Hyphomicrobiales bacterium]|nr:protein BatD [Hyphomicrobiales bacterium]
LFPEKNGNLEIGSFVHHLTLLDENNQWFEHKIKSDPIRLQVQPAPDTADWWFPVRKLEISDRWSNAPDQLKQGEGVLRVITLTAVGVGPDMLPPMPELKSPSAHIFPHPEKRLVQLSPQGPISIGIWRWTIKPRNPPSAILEPLEFSYFNTVERKMKSAVISAQRIAMVEIDTPSAKQEEGRPPVALKSVLLRIFVAMALIAGLTLILGTKRVISLDFLQQRLRQFKLKSKLKRGVKARNLQIIRQAGRALHSHAKSSDDCRQLLDHLDERIFSRTKDEFDVKGFYKRFKATL